MKLTQKNDILADGRWSGTHGIGRFSAEVLSRLTNTDIVTQGPRPLSLKNFIWQPIQLNTIKNNYRVFFTPGFTPVYHKKLPYVLTICDLIYLNTPGFKGLLKKIFFEVMLKPSIKNAAKIFTISEYSKKSIAAWANIPEEKIVNVSCGISDIFQSQGSKFSPGYRYLLHVGNTKAHKNVERLIIAFSDADIDPSIKLVFTSQLTTKISRLIHTKNLKNRLVFLNTISENELAACYRGATALTFPSLYEGFGLPILEAMASGTPVLTSNATSCPEVAGDAAILVSATDVSSIKKGIEKIANNPLLREDLIAKGLAHAKQFSWKKTAERVQKMLDTI